ncbi:MAG: succinylglutamate desuccinylase/aspartoacylase family protein [Candidatus Saccharimonadales bacterium]
MKILVIGGMHGNERLGLEVVKLFQKNPISQVDTLLANKRAIAASCRFTDQDLNRSFPGNPKAVDYEARRAAEILKKTTDYDVVLDFHNTYCPDNDCGFIGEAANDTLTDVAWLLGLDKVIVADYDCINKAAKNCLSIEVSLGSALNDDRLWYERIVMLSRVDGFDTKANIQKFRFVYRMTIEDKRRLQLDKQELRAFQALSKELASAMGVASPAYPIFIGDGFTPYNYGGLLNKINV